MPVKKTPPDVAVKRKFKRLMRELDSTYEELKFIQKRLPLKARKFHKIGIERLEKAYRDFRKGQAILVEKS